MFYLYRKYCEAPIRPCFENPTLNACLSKTRRSSLRMIMSEEETKPRIRSTEVSQRKTKLLGRILPPVYASEGKLERNTRRTLVRFRSGYSTHLNSYRHRLNNNVPGVCQLHCRVYRTSLTSRAYIENPEKAANQLQLNLITSNNVSFSRFFPLTKN